MASAKKISITTAWRAASKSAVSAVLLVGAASINPAAAHEYHGFIASEARLFFSDPALVEQADHAVSLLGDLHYYHDFAGGEQRIAFNPWLRIDSEDTQRNHVDFREAWWWRNFDAVELYVGLRKVFWGVTESVHLVDILNQTDALEDIDGEDKLGQPMIELVAVRDWGTVSAYVLPYFREREFPGKTSRLRAALPILDEAHYQSDQEEQHIDLALRWSQVIGIWDLGLSHFSGTQRSPIFRLELDADGAPVLRSWYALIEQSGLDVQATIDAWLFKLEAISIYEQDWGRHSAAAGGVEYTLYSVAGSSSDLGLVLEYQFDDRYGERRSLAQNDLVLGARWALNDVDASEVLLLASRDLDQEQLFLSLEMSRRLTDSWKIEAQARAFSSVKPGQPEYDLRRDDHLQFTLQYFF